MKINWGNWVVAGSMLLCSGVWLNSKDDALISHTTTVEIHVLRFAGEAPQRLLCRLEGQEATDAVTNFQSDGQKFCNMCLNPSPDNWYRLDFSNGKNLISSADVQMDSGQIYPYANGCLLDLTRPSLSYFQTLIARKKPVSKARKP